MKTRRAPVLVKRYNADNSLSILARGHVVERFALGFHSAADSFAKGWFQDEPVRWGQCQFRRRKEGSR